MLVKVNLNYNQKTDHNFMTNFNWRKKPVKGDFQKQQALNLKDECKNGQNKKHDISTGANGCL